MMWVDYERFYNQVIIPREKKNADAVVPAVVTTDSESNVNKDEKPII
jgi:hypothetical protein